MKCKSCAGEVPPKFAHAILTNMCPLCGEVIMDEELQVALKTLKSAMTAVTSYPAEIFDWLKSNYGLHSEADVDARVKEVEMKTTEAVKASVKATVMGQALIHNKEVVSSEEVFKKVELDKNGNQVAGPSIQSAEQTNKFFKNAEATKTLNNQQHFKNMVKQIRKSGSTSIDDGGAALTPEMMGMSSEDVDPVELSELRAAFGDNSGDVNSGLDPSDIDYEDEIPSIVMSMAKQAGGGQGMNQRDLLKLQNLQHKSASAKNEIARTGSVGLIRR